MYVRVCEYIYKQDAQTIILVLMVPNTGSVHLCHFMPCFVWFGEGQLWPIYLKGAPMNVNYFVWLLSYEDGLSLHEKDVDQNMQLITLGDQ